MSLRHSFHKNCLPGIRNFLLAFALSLAGIVYAGPRDTTFIKRPFYLGLSLGYTQFLHTSDANRFVAPVYAEDVPYSRQFNFGYSPALQLSFPFLRKMECELALQRTTWVGVRSEISEYHYGGPFGNNVVGFRTALRWFDLSVWQIRSVFSYEFKRARSYAFTAGLGGWLDLQDKNIRGNYGAEAQVKCYVESSHFGVLQFAIVAGGNGMDTYAAFRVGVMLKGTRTYRVKPDKYYIRTYEEGE